jgi:FKBP-type peptidyl-prolyl cis-trans isomerase
LTSCFNGEACGRRQDDGQLIAGLFYGLQVMHVGGTRPLRIAPHFAYGEQGVPGAIPANALLTIEVTVLAERLNLHS